MRSLLQRLTLALVAALLSACQGGDETSRTEAAYSNLPVATFAGGCFWCVEADFERIPGVVSAISGYTGGQTHSPTYEQVARGTTGHREAVEVYYDPERVSYETLLQAFWRMVDPTDLDGQFADRGGQYTTAIWYHTDEQRVAAEKSKLELDASRRYEKGVVTQILPAAPFYRAEEEHQDYYKHHAARYKFYRYLSGRDDYLEETWGSDLRMEFGKSPVRAVSPR